VKSFRASGSACGKQTQFGFWNGKFCKATIQTDHKLRNTHTWGTLIFFSPEKWIAISPVKLRRFSEPHDLQGIGSPRQARHRLTPASPGKRLYAILNTTHSHVKAVSQIASEGFLRIASSPSPVKSCYRKLAMFLCDY
jgi:hypothetical protein